MGIHCSLSNVVFVLVFVEYLFVGKVFIGYVGREIIVVGFWDAICSFFIHFPGCGLCEFKGLFWE